MIPVVHLRGLSLTAAGPTVSMPILAGQWVMVTGPGESGQADFLRHFAGSDRFAQGQVDTSASRYFAAQGGLGKRLKLQTLVGKHPQGTEWLLATRLWEVRQRVVSDLTDAQTTQAELLAALIAEESVIVLEDQLDRLDPWNKEPILSLFSDKRRSGTTIVSRSDRPDLLALADQLIVFNERQIRFAGTISDLLRHGPPSTVVVQTENQPGVRAIVEPFEVQMETRGNEVILRAAEGQAVAARLLRDGYGDVKLVKLQAANLEAALRALI